MNTKHIIAILGGILFAATPALAVTLFNVQQGGTGVGTFTASQLIYGNGTTALKSVATTTASCTGSASCTSFTIIGSTPISISAASGAAFPFTATSWGNSTSSIIGFPGVIITGSSTISNLGTGLVKVTNGLLGTDSNTYLTGVTADSPLSGSGTSGSHLVLSTAGTWSGNAGTASALAADGANCNAGSYPLGVDAAGAVQNCTVASTGTVTSIATTWPITGGTITTTGTLGYGGLSTSSPIAAASGLLYATGVNTLASVATSSAVNMSITGNAGTVTTNANLSGVVTSSGNTTSYGSQTAGVLGNAATGNTAPMATSTLYGSYPTSSYGSMLSWDGAKLALMATTTTFTGTTGQFPYFSGTNTLTATSTLFLGTNGLIGISSTTPNYRLSVGSFGNQFAVSANGTIMSAASQPATSTAITLDWSTTPPQVEYRIGTSATTITLINATTAPMWGSRKLVWVCNPGGTAGAVTWSGVEWIGTAPTQTTTANQCDVYSFDITYATSSTAWKVSGTAGTGFQ